MTSVHPPTFPARPVNGGPLPRALPKRGTWLYEPKINGWRALVHCPTGTMFNRRGTRLTIEKEFRPVLEQVRGSLVEWLDCEALERRLPIGKGALIILDALLPGDYCQRRAVIAEQFADAQWSHEKGAPPSNHLLRLSAPYAESDASAAWTCLQAVNRQLGCELFEGLVAKRADSKYPIQLRSPTQEFPAWMKHRWAF